MYAICNVVHGIPLNLNDGDQPERSAELENLIESEAQGFILLYSGSGDVAPAAFGVALSKFDEACHHVDLEGRKAPKLAPSPAQRKAFERAFASLPPHIRSELVKLYGKPRSFLLWSTSWARPLARPGRRADFAARSAPAINHGASGSPPCVF